MKLLVDMNLSPRWVVWLKDAGVDAIHWSLVGKINAPDTEIMTFAMANDYVVLTMISTSVQFSPRYKEKNQA